MASEKGKRISAKIAVLRREGKTAKQAAGEAYGMEKQGRLKKGGVYVRAKKKASKKK
jgi:hypothetical protein